MALESKCPKCAAVFDPVTHRADPAGPQGVPSGSAPRRTAAFGRVRCPQCGHEFTSLAMQVFVGPRAIFVLLACLVVAAIVFFALGKPFDK